MAHNLDIKVINEVLNKTITAIEEGKTEVFEIAENARKECNRVKQELEEIKHKVQGSITEVDRLERLVRHSRINLLNVSKDFMKYKEEDIRQAYEKANELQIQMVLKRQEERELIHRRTDLEVRLKNTYEVLQRAENLTSKIGVALEFLGGNLQGLTHTLEDMQLRDELGKRIIRAQEEERQRVARDIHDGPAQSLANVVIKTEICERLIDIDVKRTKLEIQELKKILRESIQDIRKIIYNLRPMSLDDLGFLPTVERYVKNFEDETQIQVDLIVLSQHTIEDSIKRLALFRIVQEALQNIRKHAKASVAKIKIDISHKNISLHVIDNGIGFDVSNRGWEERSQESGFGLLSMRERVELLKGAFEVKSELGKGSKIIVNIPNEE